jgi:pimeloyl-ACP methyl ester carboxylesterase
MLRVFGLELEAEWVGPPRGDAPELVFLHEGLGSITQWRDTPAVIAAGTNRSALVYAREGYGRSTPLALPRSLAYMHVEAARLPGVLAAAGVRDPVLIGHSDGASIAIIAAGHGLVAPRALVLIAPHVFVEDISVQSIAAAADAYRAGPLRERLARHHADVDGAFWGWNQVWLDPAFRAWDIRRDLRGITAPTLVVQGDRDEYGTRAQVDAIVRDVSGLVEVAWLDGAGHAPFRDVPSVMHNLINQFIERYV